MFHGEIRVLTWWVDTWTYIVDILNILEKLCYCGNEAIDNLTEHGTPQHALDQVAPGAAKQQ